MHTSSLYTQQSRINPLTGDGIITVVNSLQQSHVIAVVMQLLMPLIFERGILQVESHFFPAKAEDNLSCGIGSGQASKDCPRL
jgi:hypothetical protein